MTTRDRRWAWTAPGGPWAVAGALVAAATGAFVLGTQGSGAVPALLGWPLLAVMLGLMLGVTPFGVEPRPKTPVHLGRFAFTFGAAVLVTALLAGAPFDPLAAAVFGAGMAVTMVVAVEVMERVNRRFSPTRW